MKSLSLEEGEQERTAQPAEVRRHLCGICRVCLLVPCSVWLVRMGHGDVRLWDAGHGT